METFLHATNADVFCGIVGKTTDFTQLSKLVNVVPQRGPLVVECVRAIETNSDPVNYPFNWDTTFVFPKIERVDLPLTITLEQLRYFAYHPTLRRFWLEISPNELSLVASFVKANEQAAYLDFLRDFRSVTYDYRGTRIQNNRDFRDAFIVVRRARNTQLVVTGEHLYAALPAPASRNMEWFAQLIKVTGSKQLWRALGASVLRVPRIDRMHCIVYVGFPAEVTTVNVPEILKILDTTREQVDTDAISFHFYYAGPIGRGQTEEAFRQLITQMQVQVLQISRDRWRSIRFPLAYTGLPQNILPAESLDETTESIDFIAENEVQLQLALTQLQGRRISFFRFPGSEPLSDLPEYPLYRSIEDLMRIEAVGN